MDAAPEPICITSRDVSSCPTSVPSDLGCLLLLRIPIASGMTGAAVGVGTRMIVWFTFSKHAVVT